MNLSKIETLELAIQFEAIFEAFPDILFKLSREGKILTCKAGKSPLKDINPEKFVGCNIKDILPSICLETFVFAVSKLSQPGDIECLEFPYDNGSTKYWFEARLVPFYKNQVLAILRDITEKKEMENLLHKEIGHSFKKNAAVNVSSKSADLKGLETEKLGNSADAELLKTKIQEYNILNDRLKYEIDLRRGMESTLKMHLEDIKKRNRELEYFRFLASNDFQDPIRQITAFAKLMARKYKENIDKEGQEMLDFMINGGELMQRIVVNISEFIGIGKTNEIKERVFVEDNVVLAKKQLAKKIEQKNAQIFFDELPVIFANRRLINILFEQLLDNALKFGRDDVPMEILIGVRKHPDFYEFYVKDNGIGFKMEFHDRIFLPFQRLHPRTAFPGAGIGLAFCKKIIEHHNGEIWAESFPGEGSTFYFTIPVL